MTETKKVHVRGIDYAITDSAGLGVPVMLVHGWPDDRTIWRHKQVKGFQTGDLIQAQVPTGKKAGTYQGQVAIRATGSFNIQTRQGVVQGISHRHCRLLQRADGYGYTFQPKPIQEDASRAV